MGPDLLGFQKFVVSHAIAPHHRDKADINFTTETSAHHILKPDGARFFNFFQPVLIVGLSLWHNKTYQNNRSKSWVLHPIVNWSDTFGSLQKTP
jgi:hypothetical protein